MTFTLRFKNLKDDDYQYQIETEQGESYLERVLAIIVNEDEIDVAEISGYVLFTENIVEERRNSFFVMDGISQLLCNVHEFISENTIFFYDTNKTLYLNMLLLNEDNRNDILEEEIIEFLSEKYDNIIYSLGSAELMDKNFPIYQESDYLQFWNKKLIEKGWSYNELFDFYFYNSDRCIE